MKRTRQEKTEVRKGKEKTGTEDGHRDTESTEKRVLVKRTDKTGKEKNRKINREIREIREVKRKELPKKKEQKRPEKKSFDRITG